MDFRGDPSSALLEVLDPEQNHTFTDHYLDVEFDLSSVFFIATANVLHTIPQPLQDRMEVLRLPGYTEREKVEIAKRHIVPKQIESHGLKPENVDFSEDSLQELIRRYTREAGVRNMEREISSICRKVARKVVVEGREFHGDVTPDNINTYLGIPRYRASRAEERNEIGLAIGLAWTEVGGETLPIEVTLMPGKGHLTLTGKLGDVMQESARAALSWVRSKAEEYGIAQGLPPQDRRAHPRARGRHPQGRPLGRHHHRHRARIGPDQGGRAARRGHDRRDHAARQGAAHRRA